MILPCGSGQRPPPGTRSKIRPRNKPVGKSKTGEKPARTPIANLVSPVKSKRKPRPVGTGIKKAGPLRPALRFYAPVGRIIPEYIVPEDHTHDTSYNR